MEQENLRYVYAVLSRDTKIKIYNFCEKNKIPNHLNLDEFHITLMYSLRDTDITREDLQHQLFKICTPYKFQVFGGSLVVLFKSEYLTGRFKYFVDKGGVYPYPVYYPHVSLTYNIASYDLSKLNINKFPTVIVVDENGEERTNMEY